MADDFNEDARIAREALVRGLRAEAERVAAEMEDETHAARAEDRMMTVVVATAIADTLNRIEGRTTNGEPLASVNLTPR